MIQAIRIEDQYWIGELKKNQMKAKINRTESHNLEQNPKGQNHYGLNQIFKLKNFKNKGKKKWGRFQN